MKKIAAWLALAIAANSALAMEPSNYLLDPDDEAGIAYSQRLRLEAPRFFAPPSVIIKMPCLDPKKVVVLRNAGGLKIKAELLYLTPRDNQLDYAIVDPTIVVGNNGVAAPSEDATIRTLNPTQTFGYRVELGYNLPCSGTDVLLDAQTLTTDDSDTVLPPVGGTIWTSQNIYQISLFSAAASEKASYSFGAGNLIFGDKIYAGSRFFIHPYMGIGYTQIERKIRTIYFDANSIIGGATPVTLGDATVFSKSTFKGVGPRLGVDSEFLFTPHLGLDVHGSTSFYSGSIASNAIETSTNPESPIVIGSRIEQGNVDRLVPALEGRLGLAYIFPCAKFKVELGYQASHYFNALNSYRNGGATFIFRHIKTVNDFNVYGPYLNFNLYDLGCPFNCRPDPLCVKDDTGFNGFEVGFGALYLTPGHNFLDYAISDPAPVIASLPDISFIHPSVQSTMAINNPKAGLGWQANIGYHFYHSPYDLNLSYQWYDKRNTNSVLAPQNGVIWDLLTFLGDQSATTAVSSSATSVYKSHYENIDFDFGQRIISPPDWNFRLFGGLRYTQFDNNFDTFYEGPLDVINQPLPGTGHVLLSSDFEGIGPRAGAKLNYNFAHCLSLVGEGSAAYLVSSKSSAYLDEEPTLNSPEIRVRHDFNRSEEVLVPNLQGKIALNFHPAIMGQERELELELGYLVNHYFNGLNHYNETKGAGGFITKQVNDISLQGYYLNVAFRGLGGQPNCYPGCDIYARRPEFIGGVQFSVEAMYYNLTSPLFDYALINNPSTGDSAFTKIEPGYDFGYRLHLAYIFPCSANDLSIDYDTYDTSVFDSLNAPSGSILFPIFSSLVRNVNSAPLFAQAARARFGFTSDSIDLDFGTYVKFNCLNLRFLTGISNFNYKEKFDVVYSGVVSRDELPVNDSHVHDQNKYEAFGPRFGVDPHLTLGEGFGIAGHVATNFYIGSLNSSHFEENGSGFEEADALAFNTALNPKKQNRLVTNLELRLGLDYVLPVCRCTTITYELGYEIDHYFNMMNVLRYNTQRAESFVKQENDLSFQGPYLKVIVDL